MNNDLISREALKEHKFIIPQGNIIGGMRCGKTRELIIKEYQKGWNDCIDAIIDNAPTVKAFTEEDMAGAYNEGYACGGRESKRPQGEWIRTGSLGNGNAQYECSNCHYGDEQAESQEVPYCWHCGAKMRKGGVK